MYNSNIYAEKIVVDSTKSKTLPFLEKIICFYEDFIIISKNPFYNEDGLLLVEFSNVVSTSHSIYSPRKILARFSMYFMV
jgi:hypothetical protein